VLAHRRGRQRMSSMSLITGRLALHTERNLLYCSKPSPRRPSCQALKVGILREGLAYPGLGIAPVRLRHIIGVDANSDGYLANMVEGAPPRVGLDAACWRLLAAPNTPGESFAGNQGAGEESGASGREVALG
jgi:hypothetical protein